MITDIYALIILLISQGFEKLRRNIAQVLCCQYLNKEQIYWESMLKLVSCCMLYIVPNILMSSSSTVGF